MDAALSKLLLGFDRQLGINSLTLYKQITGVFAQRGGHTSGARPGVASSSPSGAARTVSGRLLPSRESQPLAPVAAAAGKEGVGEGASVVEGGVPVVAGEGKKARKRWWGKLRSEVQKLMDVTAVGLERLWDNAGLEATMFVLLMTAFLSINVW